MKLTVLAISSGLIILLNHSPITQATTQEYPGSIVIGSSKENQVVTFAAAYVSGDSTSSSSLEYRILKTPYRIHIDSARFFGIFKKVSGDADMVLLLANRITHVKVSKSVVLVTKSGDEFRSEGF
jgi:hypothetical protein